MDKQVREEVLKLIEQKEQLEKEIRELQKILLANHVGMDDPLVDAEGFPLSYIDIYQVRHTRHLLIHKQNDYKDLMKQIELGIEEYYAKTDGTVKQVTPKPEYTEPFARIHVVHPGSPADAAGIKDGDLLVEFGSVNATNFRNLNDIGAVVSHTEGHRIIVKLKRNDAFMRAALVPRRWSGNGLLGCNVLPF